MRKLVSFDLETTHLLSEKDIDELGIATAGLQTSLVNKIYFMDAELSKEKCIKIVTDLIYLADQGFTIVTHNGAYFDFRVLANNSGMVEECAKLMLDSIDSHFYIWCKKGFFVSVDAICAGMLLDGKMIEHEGVGIRSKLVPELWRSGKQENMDAVIAYQMHDCQVEYDMINTAIEREWMAWRRRGRLYGVIFKPMTVRECLLLPQPGSQRKKGKPQDRRGRLSWAEEYLPDES